MSMIATWPAQLSWQAAFNSCPGQASPPPYWTDISTRTIYASNSQRGRQYELDINPVGQANIPLDNRDGQLDPSNTGSAFWPDVIPYRSARIRAMVGVNVLSMDQATCGQGTPYPAGTSPTAFGVTNDYGYSVTTATSASAYYGTQVYLATLPSGAAQYSTVILVPTVPVVPGQWYTATALVRIPSGNSVSMLGSLTWLTSGGTTLSTVGGSAQAVTSGSSTWTTVTVTGQAPTGSTPGICAAFRIQINAALTAQTLVQVGALQVEQSATATPLQVPQTVPANLLPQVIATGSASLNPASDSVANYFYAQAGTLTQGTFLTPAPTGQTTAVGWQSPAGTTSSPNFWFGNTVAGSVLAQPDCCQVTAGQAYTGSWYSMRLASADATLQITPGIFWFTAANAFISESVGTAVTIPAGSWVRVTASGTAPAGAAWARLTYWISSPNPTTAQNTIYLTGAQFEQAGAASAWMDPGPTRYIFTGATERWPQTWLMSGVMGQSGTVAVDAGAMLGQGLLGDPFANEVLTYNPNFFYTLGDPVGAASVVDTAARRSPAPIENSPFGPGSLILGSSVSGATTTGGVLGSSATCALFANNPSGATPFQYAETFINLAKTTVAPGPPASNPWTRMVSFNAGTTVPGTGNDYNLWTSYPPSFESTSNLSTFYMGVNATGGLTLGCWNANNRGMIYAGTANVCDGNWHQVAIVIVPGTFTGTFYMDGVQLYTHVDTQSPTPTGCFTDALGCSINYGSNQYSQGFAGSLAHAIEIPAALTQAQITNLYQSWRNASAGDSSGGRVQRVLNWVGYQGPTSIETGSTTNMGPATDITGSSALSAINTVAQTENGNAYVSASGAITFKARSDRYNQATPMYVFGEQAQYGEWPYESIGFDFDPSHLYDNIQVTQYSTSQIATAVSASSQTLYGQRVLQVTMNQGNFSESQDAANYMLSRYGTASMRVSSLTLHPAAVFGMFQACLAMEIGTRIRIMRRPPSPAAPIQVDAFIEAIAWSIDPTSGDATVKLQCSPADLASYWTMAALHTTLNTSVTAGTSSATINALPDAAYNALASSLPSGYQLTFDPGTSIQETLTISPPLPSTGIGYTSATINFTTSFVNNHSSGAVVCEPLPAGYTNPAAWDQGSILGCAYTTFAAAASSGASTITVGQLPDWKTNALTSNWNIGDLLSLSPGTANWEGYNLLTPNQSTAGGGMLPLAAGTSGNSVGVMSALGTFSVLASATAWQGGSVWQATIGASATSGFRLLRIALPAIPGQVYSASYYVRSVTSGANPQVAAQLGFTTAANATIASTTGTSVTLTGSATAAWARVTVTATAPAGAVWVQAGIPLAATGPGSSWAFQADGLQVEPNASPSTYQTCPQIQSVSTSVPGYTTATITLATPLASNHAIGDYVSDPLPAGTTNPAMFPATTRIAY